MYGSERRRHITELLAGAGRVSVTGLAADLDVSTETVRRDLSTLESEGRLERTHGGAVPVVPGGRTERTLDARRAENVSAKQAIGRAALRLLPAPGGSIVLDAGSTTARLAEALPPDHGLTVFTNSVPHADLLHRADTPDLHLIGGQVRGLTAACVGPTALGALDPLRVDLAVLGTNGLHEDRGLTTQDPDEAAVKRAMCGSARRVAVLADAAKLGHEFLLSFAPLESVDVLVTDVRPSGPVAAALDELGIEVVLP